MLRSAQLCYIKHNIRTFHIKHDEIVSFMYEIKYHVFILYVNYCAIIVDVLFLHIMHCYAHPPPPSLLRITGSSIYMMLHALSVSVAAVLCVILSFMVYNCTIMYIVCSEIVLYKKAEQLC